MRFALVGLLLVACTPTEPVELGATCSSVSVKEACAKGGKLATCSGGKWQESMSCLGPKGCYLHKGGHGSTTPLCDEGLARPGNPCADARDVLCSEDKKARLACKGGRWQVQAACAKGCSYNPNGITCE
jgi:hypothetical protein